MPVPIKMRIEAERQLQRLVQLNDALVQQMQALVPLLDRILGLSFPARNKLNAVLSEMGIDVADFDVLLANLSEVRTVLEAKLSLQQP